MLENNSETIFPYTISFADCQTSDAATAQIEKHIFKIAKRFDRVIECRVIVRIPNKHHLKHFYHIHIQMDVPGRTLIVGREPEMNSDHMEINVAIRDAFDKLTRQLEGYRDARTAPRRRREDLQAM